MLKKLKKKKVIVAMNNRKPTIIDLFKPGDLLYGLQSERAKIAKNLQQQHPNERITIDEYNKLILKLLIPAIDTQAPFDENAYKNYLMEYRKNPEEINMDERLLKHICILFNFESKKVGFNTSFKERSASLDLSDRQIKRLCKARILDPDITIHFILDGLDAENIFDESSTKNKKNYHSFTSAELRYVIKNFDDIEGHIKFYSNNEEISLLDWISGFSDEAKASFKNWQNNPEKNRFQQKETLAKRFEIALAQETGLKYGECESPKPNWGSIFSSPPRKQRKLEFPKTPGKENNR